MRQNLARLLFLRITDSPGAELGRKPCPLICPIRVELEACAALAPKLRSMAIHCHTPKHGCWSTDVTHGP